MIHDSLPTIILNLANL